MSSNPLLEFLKGAEEGKTGSNGELGYIWKEPGGEFQKLYLSTTVVVKFLTKAGDSRGSPITASGSGELVTGILASLNTEDVGEDGTGWAGIERRVLIVANIVFKIALVVDRYVSQRNLPCQRNWSMSSFVIVRSKTFNSGTRAGARIITALGQSIMSLKGSTVLLESTTGMAPHCKASRSRLWQLSQLECLPCEPAIKVNVDWWRTFVLFSCDPHSNHSPSSFELKLPGFNKYNSINKSLASWESSFNWSRRTAIAFVTWLVCMAWKLNKYFLLAGSWREARLQASPFGGPFEGGNTMSKPGRKLTPSGNVDCAINASPVLISEDGKLEEWLPALIVKYKIKWFLPFPPQ